MKLRTLAFGGAAALIGFAALSVPSWTSESGKPSAKPTPTAPRKSVTFTVHYTPGPADGGPEVLDTVWTVGPANGSPTARPGAVIDTRRGRRGEVVTFHAKPIRSYRSARPVTITCVAFYDQVEIGRNSTADTAGCSIATHVPSTGGGD